MDIKAVAGKITDYILPFFKKSKSIKQISQEIGEAADNELGILWNSVKGWFIKEYEEETPIDDSFEAEDIKALIKSELKKADEATKKAIEEALVQASKSQGQVVVNNNNSKIGQQNINSTVTNTNPDFNL